MHDCPDGAVRDHLPDLVNDRLAPDVRGRVDAHLRECADCRREVELLRDVRSSMRRAPVVNVGAIASAIPAYRAPRRVWSGWRAAAAVIILAVGGTSLAMLQQESGNARDRRTPVATSAQGGTSPSAQPSASMLPRAIVEPERDLAIGNPAIDELDDRELSMLLEGLETIEALPSPDEDRSVDLTVRDLRGTD